MNNKVISILKELGYGIGIIISGLVLLATWIMIGISIYCLII